MSQLRRGGSSRPARKSSRDAIGNTREENKVIAVFVDGKKTESEYFRGWKREIGNRGLVINPIYINSGGNPLKAVQEMISKIGHEREFDELWCVCDVDGANPSAVQKADSLAKKVGAKLILSDRCFEIWIALHWRAISLNTITCEREAVNLVSQYYSEYKSDNKLVPFSVLRERTEVAIKNAVWLEGQNCVNPRTMVHTLVRRILSLSEGD